MGGTCNEAIQCERGGKWRTGDKPQAVQRRMCSDTTVEFLTVGVITRLLLEQLAVGDQ